jgi:hypothetical protein
MSVAREPVDERQWITTTRRTRASATTRRHSCGCTTASSLVRSRPPSGDARSSGSWTTTGNGIPGGRISSREIIKELSVFPNPVENGQLTVKASLSEICDVSLELFQVQSNRREYQNWLEGKAEYNQVIDVRHLPAGLYVLIVKVQEEIRVAKIIKL